MVEECTHRLVVMSFLFRTPLALFSHNTPSTNPSQIRDSSIMGSPSVRMRMLGPCRTMHQKSAIHRQTYPRAGTGPLDGLPVLQHFAFCRIFLTDFLGLFRILWSSLTCDPLMHTSIPFAPFPSEPYDCTLENPQLIFSCENGSSCITSAQQLHGHLASTVFKPCETTCFLCLNMGAGSLCADREVKFLDLGSSCFTDQTMRRTS